MFRTQWIPLLASAAIWLGAPAVLAQDDAGGSAPTFKEGDVITGLERLGLQDNTIVIFTSDNGGVASGDAFSTSNLPFRGGKGYHWEGGIKAPYLIHVPDQNSDGKKSDYPVTGADFYPTILDYAQIDLLPGQHMDGISLKPLINDGVELPERPLYWHYPHYGNQGGDPSSVIREGDWKLIHYYEEDINELYHIVKDPYEQLNVASVYPEVTNNLSNKLMQWLDDVNALYPVKDEEYDAGKRAAYDKNIMTKRLTALEKQRKDFLSADFEPNPDWWGSRVTED